VVEFSLYVLTITLPGLTAKLAQNSTAKTGANTGAKNRFKTSWETRWKTGRKICNQIDI
jgi:hypothetical protein